ncbi:DNA topoisomerase IV subunit B [Pseudooceanicola batsensis HTCC2597]|uniref:DNA topoisomerase IV subunit B n=1 Tax=Pseudooceanicola batsensis (strain ATCC BAA-863 / DSM 15984 / KCTC 12145 / HTCC2597) TaxID=252305 RepID=A3TYW2_PSEBH|nr:DNA topoisomerase IV subunit B [Pseudooceanicola batsensis HTCC2597]
METLIWLPLFVWMLAMAINVTFILFDKNQAFRIVQDANRTLSTGYLLTEAQTEAFISDRLATIAPDAVVSTTINDGIVTSNVSYQVDNLFLPHVVKDLMNMQIAISAQHFMEY